MSKSNYTEITDANGKSFNIDISKIFDINGDLDNNNTSIKDSILKNRLNFQHDVEIVDAKGNALDSDKLIADLKGGSTNIVAVDVETESTHSGKNHNYCVYYEESMEKDSESFMNPFRKPMLKNHDDHSEPLGRVIESSFGPSELTNERSAIRTKVRVTDQDAIPKFLDKRYGTVSIGGTMGTVTCNICGKTILKDGKFHFCGHWRGETYKDQVCYWGAKDIEYHELSVVNNPADDFAQVMKVTVLTDKDIQNDKKEEKDMPGTDARDSKNTNVDDIIDQALGTVSDNSDAENAEDDATTTKTEAQDGDKSEAKNESESKEETESSDNNDDDNKESEDKEKKEEPATDDNKEDAGDEDSESEDARVTELEKQLSDAKAKIDELENDAIEYQSQIETLKKTAEDAREESNSFKQRCVALATANKQMIVDNIVSKEQFETEDDKTERVKDLMMKSMKELKTIGSEKAKTQRTQASITSPCLAVDDPVGNGEKKEVADTDNTKKSRNLTVNDAAQEVVEKLLRGN